MPLSELPPPISADGQDLPLLRVAPPGPLSRSWVTRLERVESPAFGVRRGARAGVAEVEQAPIVYASAGGSNVFDVDGNRYVDMAAGFGAMLLGHGSPRTARALEMQSARLWHALGDVYASDGRIALMERIAALYPEKGARVMLGQSGADAVTAALKTAVLATGKPGVVAFEGAYHGLSYGPLAACGYRASYREPFAAQLSPHVRFAPFPARTEDVDAALTALDRELARGDVGAVLIEPVLGRGGCVPAPARFLTEVRARATRGGALLVADEIWTGLGRSGAMLASTDEGVVPDLICLGKGLGGGLPLSACVGSDAVLQAWAKGPAGVVHTATFHGSPLACATGIALLDAVRIERLAERAGTVGTSFRESIRERLLELPSVTAVRGRGLMVGVELGSAALALAVARDLLASGWIVLTGGARGDVLTLTPPLNIAESLLDAFVAALFAAVEAREQA